MISMTTELVGESMESESEETMPSYDTFLRNTNRYIVINCQSSIRYIDVDLYLDIISDIVIVLKIYIYPRPNCKCLFISTYLQSIFFSKLNLTMLVKNSNCCIRFVDQELWQV